MAPDPQCAALNAAMTRAGKTYAQLAAEVGRPEQHVIDVCTGNVKPTRDEFNALAQALGITESAPADASHATVG